MLPWLNIGFYHFFFGRILPDTVLGFVHPTNELVTVVDGLMEVSVSGQTALLEPGDEIFIPKGGVHDVINRSSGMSRWLYGYD